MHGYVGVVRVRNRRVRPRLRAQAGNVQMLIWLGKQLLGQKDSSKVEQTGPAGAAIKHEVQVTLSDAEREQVKAFLGC